MRTGEFGCRAVAPVVAVVVAQVKRYGMVG